MPLPTVALSLNDPTTLIGMLVIFVFMNLSTLEKIWGWITGSQKKKNEANETRLKGLEDCISKFVNKESLDERFDKLDKSIKIHSAELVSHKDQHMEHVRFREKKSNEIDHKLETHAKDIRSLENIPSRVQNLENKYETIEKKLDEVNQTLKNLPKSIAEDMKEYMELLIKANK